MTKALWMVVCAGCMVGDPAPGEVTSFASSAGSPDPSGAGDTYFASGALDPTSPFYASLGTNGRVCATCHRQAQGWSITPADVQARFQATGGTDPIFRPVDGATSPNADVSTVAARHTAYSMLLSKGLIRVGLPLPAHAEFTLAAVDDPYHFASASQLSLFRRPLPSTNLPFLSTVMWDGRENTSPFDLASSLGNQAMDATLGHAQATGADSAQMSSIASFESQLYTAQISDSAAGKLPSGPSALAEQEFYLGINDPFGGAFDPRAFTLFDSWSSEHASSAKSQRRASIYRGQQLFDARPISITGVKGLNDVLGRATIAGTCTTCHDTPNVGNHSVAAPLDIGIADASRRTPDLPLYTLRNNSTGATIRTTDPGRALVTGKWADIGKFKGPVLRGLAMRAPYFHNGSAATLADVVSFYDTRFAMNLSAQDKADLVAFLSAL